MRPRSVRAGIALRATLACAVVCVVTAVRDYRAEVRAYGADAGERLAAFGGYEQARCVAAPERWGGDVGGGVQIWAYDGELQSRNPAAPPLPPALRDRLRAGEARPALAGMVAARVAGRGPCAIAVARRVSGEPLGRPAGLAHALARAVIASLVIALVVAIVVHPLVRRIRRLADALAGGVTRYPDGVDHLADELGALDRALAGAARRVRAELAAQAAQRATLETLVRHTAHDVGTPLAILYGQLDALGQTAATGAAVTPAAIAIARDELQHLAGVVGNLAALARAGAGTLASGRRVADLRDAVERVALRHQRLGASHGVAVEHAVPSDAVPVAFEPVALQQALGNLIANAIAYGRPGGYVAVVLEARAGRFRLRVIDDGDALTDADLAAIARGTRGVLGRRRRPTGSGLGLAIVRTIADAHGFALTTGRSSDGGLEVALAGVLAEAVAPPLDGGA